MFKIIYPEARVVDGAQIIRWYQDAVVNGEVEEPNTPEPLSARRAAMLLHANGLITLHSDSYWESNDQLLAQENA